MKGYHDIVGDGGSRILEQVAEQRTRIADGLAGVRHLVAVGSGKGGVGKSTLTLHLAGALRARGLRIGILDADFNGPSQARMAGVQGALFVPGSQKVALPIASVRPLRKQVAVAFSQQRLMARLTSFFGLLSLVLASIGLYGVTAFNAGRRINEIGVRLALGATRGQVVRLVVRGAFRLILFGLIMGLPLTYAVGLFLGAQLYGASPFNPGVVLAAAFVLAASAALASWVPALRASLTSPIEALRVE